MKPISQKPAEPQRSAGWEWLLCGVLLSATMLNYADRQALPMMAARVKTELKLNNQQYGQVEGIFGLAFGVGALVCGILADWISVRWLFPLLMLAWSAAGFATGWVETFSALWVTRMMLGLFEAGHWPCSLRTTQRVFHPARRPLANSILQGGAPIGAILPSLLILMLVTDEAGSWRQVFWYLALWGVPWAIVWLVAVRASDLERPVLQTVDADQGGEALMQELPFFRILLTRRFLLLLFVVMCINLTWHYVRVWMPIALEENLGYTSAQVQKFFIAYWTATFIGSLSAGWLTSQLAKRAWPVHSARLAVFFGFSVVTSLAAVAAFLPGGWLFVGIMLLIGFGSLGLFPIYYSLNQELSAKHQGKVGGSLGFAAWFILYFIHPRIGWLMDNFPDRRPYLFAAVGLLPLIACAALAVLWGRRPEQH